MGGFVWLQQSVRAPLGKISEAYEVVLKQRPAHLSLNPSIHPSLLLDPPPPLIHIWNYKSLSYGWLITHVMTKFKCESIRTAQKAIEILSEKCWCPQQLLSIFKKKKKKKRTWCLKTDWNVAAADENEFNTLADTRAKSILSHAFLRGPSEFVLFFFLSYSTKSSTVFG